MKAAARLLAGRVSYAPQHAANKRKKKKGVPSGRLMTHQSTCGGEGGTQAAIPNARRCRVVPVSGWILGFGETRRTDPSPNRANQAATWPKTPEKTRIRWR